MDRREAEFRRDLATVESKREALTDERAQLYARQRSGDAQLGLAERIIKLNNSISRLDEVRRGLNDRMDSYDRVRELAGRPENLEPGDGGDDGDDHERSPEQDAALRVIERKLGHQRAEAADRLDGLVRGNDPRNIGARYIAAVAEPDYMSAFGKMAMDPTTGHLRMTRAETLAVQRVSEVEHERAMSLTGTAGGFAVPFELDPTLMLSSGGAINPIREIARVTTISVDEWRGVRTDGVVAAFAAEASEVPDNTPTLAQPTISTEKAHAFVPFSIELGNDWPSLQEELRGLFADAKDELEATKFVSGTGVNEPQGILVGLTTAQRVLTAGAGAITVGDVYALKQAVPARFQPGSRWAMHPNRADAIFRLTPSGSTTEPQMMPTRDGDLIGLPVSEVSTMPTAATTGTKWAVIGDFQAGYRIVDRIGLSVELVPHLFGANRRPTGERGLYAYWRVGAGVVIANALRYGEVA